jgi:hypothetical protein
MYTSSLVLLLTLAQAASPRASPQDKVKVKAQELLTEGSHRYEDGDYAGALDKFSAAYAAYPSPKLMFNIGQANRELSRPVEALEAFEKVLASELDTPEDTAADARRFIAQLQKNLGRIRIACTVSGAKVSVDGKDVGTTPLPKPIWVTRGRHQVTASQADGVGAIGNVEVNVGEVTSLTLRPQAMTLALVPAPLASARNADGSQGWWLGRKWTWIAAGTTLLLTTGAAASGLAMQSKFDSLNSSCGSASPNRSGCVDSDIASVRTRRDLANVLWGLAAAGVVTTGVLFYVEGSPMTVTPTVGVATGFIATIAY